MEHGNKKHGLSGTKFYRSWFSMKDRCRNKNAINYKNYGGRGISYEKKRDKFDNFYKDMYETYKEGLTLDRIDNNRNYNKENCKWSTYKQQANNKRNNEVLIIDGISKNINEWLNIYNIDYRTYYSRVRMGMDKIEALKKTVEIRYKKIKFNGYNLTLRNWSEKLGIGYKTLYRRIYIKKYPLEKALNSNRYDGKTIV